VGEIQDFLTEGRGNPLFLEGLRSGQMTYAEYELSEGTERQVSADLSDVTDGVDSWRLDSSESVLEAPFNLSPFSPSVGRPASMSRGRRLSQNTKDIYTDETPISLARIERTQKRKKVSFEADDKIIGGVKYSEIIKLEEKAEENTGEKPNLPVNPKEMSISIDEDLDELATTAVHPDDETSVTMQEIYPVASSAANRLG
jgi:hypothetical protein